MVQKVPTEIIKPSTIINIIIIVDNNRRKKQIFNPFKKMSLFNGFKRYAFDRINNNKFFLLNNSEIVSYLALGLGQPSIEVRLINGGSTKENSLYQ